MFKLRFINLLFAGTLLFASCVTIERNNPDDPKSSNYIGQSTPPVTPSCPNAAGESNVSYAVYGTPIEYMGETYQTVVIGSQTWMARNLNYNASGSKCYENFESNCATYGRLYDWETAKTVCPESWHLPSHEEWKMLSDFVGENTAGTKLKAKDGWNNYKECSGNGTDNYGFAALPGGYSWLAGGYRDVGDIGYWWSASYFISDNTGSVYARQMSRGYGVVLEFGGSERNLYSVRCIMDIW